jgi:hypothetical protein
MATLQLLFGVTDVTSLLLQGKCSFAKSINQRWTLRMLLYDRTQAHRPAAGQPFTLKEDGTTIFTGFIDQIDEYADMATTVSNTSAPVYYDCSCSSWASVCDHRMLDVTYPTGRDAYSIIQDIFNNTISADGITLGTFSALPFIQQPLVFQGVPVSQAFDSIRDYINEQWWIDETKALVFQAVGSGSVAVWTVDGTAEISGSFKVTTTTKDFRNIQWIATGAGISTVSRVDQKTVTSATDWWFITSFPMTTVAPTVTVNGVPQKVFQREVDPNFQNGWYWEPNFFGVQQGTQTAPPIGSIIQVTYDAATDNTTSAQNSASITARAAIEGTSGKWENVVQAQQIQSYQIAQQLAQGLLARSSSIPQIITFKTYRNTYKIGQQVPVNIPMHGINANYTCMAIQAQHIAGMSDPLFSKSFLYTITLSNAQDIGGYVKFFETIFAQIKASAPASGGGSSSTSPAPITSGPGGGGGDLWFAEKPIGTYNGSNTVFTLSYTPTPQFVIWVELNGVFQAPAGSGNADYSLSGNTITFTVAPKSTDYCWCIYRRGGPSTPGAPGASAQARQFGAPASGSSGSGGYASVVGTFHLPNGTSQVGFGTPLNGDTVTVGSVTYTWRTTPSSANDVSVVTVSGFTPAQCLANAINGGYGAGTLYGSGTTANPDATALYNSLGQLSITCKPSPSVNPVSLSASSSALTFTPASISPGAMTNGDTITVGGKTYTFVNSLNNSTPNQILTQAPLAFANIGVWDMLAYAINNGPVGSGQLYSSATTANANVQAVADDANNKVTATALTPGTPGNSITCSASASTRFGDGAGHWDGGATTLSGGTGTPYGGGGSPDQINWGAGVSRFLITGDLSLGVWLKLPSNATKGVIIEYGQKGVTMANNTPFYIGVSPYLGGPNDWSIHYFHDYNSSITEQTDYASHLANDTWYFIGLVRDDTAKTIKLYKAQVGDTSLTFVSSFSYTHSPNGGTDPANALTLGSQVGGEGTEGDGPLTGTIEEHYVWNRTLTTTELLSAMAGNPPLNGLVLGCKMGDTPEVDISGNGASGVVTGTTLVQGHS